MPWKPTTLPTWNSPVTKDGVPILGSGQNGGSGTFRNKTQQCYRAINFIHTFLLYVTKLKIIALIPLSN